MKQKPETSQSIAGAACWKNRKGIALLAAGSLQGDQARALKSHIETCAGCRQAFEALIELAAALLPGHLEPEVEPSVEFHRQLMRRLRQEPASAPSRSTAGEVLASLLKWRWQAAAAAITLLVVLLFILRMAVLPSNPASTRPSSYAGQDHGGKPQNVFSPTVASYEAAASQSLDNLDALLTRQAERSSPGMPVYRASPFAVSLSE